MPPSVFRPQYRPLSDVEKLKIDRIKDLAQQLHDEMQSPNLGREMSLARTNLEQAVMWAVKSITG